MADARLKLGSNFWTKIFHIPRKTNVYKLIPEPFMADDRMKLGSNF